MRRFLLGCCALVWLGATVNAVLAAPKTLQIAMVLWRGETDAEKGFREGLRELGYTTQYTVMNAGQDRAELGRLLREDLKPKLDKLDYVYVFGTTVTLATKSIVQDKVPLIFNIVADPVGAGVVRTMEASGGNVAGVTNDSPLALQLQTALAVFPFKRLGLLFNPRERNSMLVREKLVEVARPLGVEVVDLRSPPAQDMLEDNLRKLRDRSIVVDAVYLPADSFIVSRSKFVAAELRAAGIRSIGAIDRYIGDGALLGLVPEYLELGKAAAMLVHRHQGGQKLQEMAVQFDKEPTLMINAATSRALQVGIPAALRKRARIVE